MKYMALYDNRLVLCFYLFPSSSLSFSPLLVASDIKLESLIIANLKQGNSKCVHFLITFVLHINLSFNSHEPLLLLILSRLVILVKNPPHADQHNSLRHIKLYHSVVICP